MGITGPEDCPGAYGGALPSLTPLAAAASAVPCVWVIFHISARQATLR